MVKRIKRGVDVIHDYRSVVDGLESRFEKVKKSKNPEELKKLLADSLFVGEQTESEASRTKKPEMYDAARWAYGCAGACAKYLGDYTRYKRLTKQSNNISNIAAVDADFHGEYNRRFFLDARYNPDDIKESRRYIAKKRLENRIKNRGSQPNLGIILIILIFGVLLFIYPNLTGNIINESQINAFNLSGALLFICSLFLLGIYIYNRKKSK